MFESLEEMLQATYQNDFKLFETILKFRFSVEIKNLDFMQKQRTLHKTNKTKQKKTLQTTITLIHSSEV